MKTYPLTLLIILSLLSCSSDGNYNQNNVPQIQEYDERIIGPWLTKKASSNILTKTFFQFKPGGVIDGYQMTYMRGMGEYGQSGPEPSPVIEDMKQKGTRWFTSNGSVFCFSTPSGQECYNYQFNGDDLEFYSNGQLAISLSVP